MSPQVERVKAVTAIKEILDEIPVASAMLGKTVYDQDYGFRPSFRKPKLMIQAEPVVSLEAAVVMLHVDFLGLLIISIVH